MKLGESECQVLGTVCGRHEDGSGVESESHGAFQNVRAG